MKNIYYLALSGLLLVAFFGFLQVDLFVKGLQ
jgi:hypothetical protein